MPIADRVLGIDPGSRIAGLAVAEETRGKLTYIDSASLKIPATLPLEQRLKLLHTTILDWLVRYQPGALAVEAIFHHKNVRSALTLAHARGVVLMTAALHDVPCFEYSPLEVKSACTGYGRAEKQQLALMLAKLYPALKVKNQTHFDETDALAIAHCHLSQRKLKHSMGLTEVSAKGKSLGWDDWLAARESPSHRSRKSHP